jgi:hypothetical protein
MAGLAIDVRFSEEPTTRRGWLRSAYDFLCLLYAKWPSQVAGGSEMVWENFHVKLKVIRRKRALGAF